jgi:hypothetical protein
VYRSWNSENVVRFHKVVSVVKKKVVRSCNSGEVVKCRKSLIVERIEQKLKTEFHVLFVVDWLG